MIMNAFRQGWSKASAFKSLVGIWFFANLVFAWFVMSPFRGLISNHAGHSLVGERSLGLMDFNYLSELLQQSTAWAAAGSGFRALVVVWILFSLFMAGAVLGSMDSDRPFNLTRFAGNGGRYFLPFMAQLLIFALVLLVFVVLAVLFGKLVDLAIGEHPFEYISFWFGLLKLLVWGGLIWYWKRLIDYGRLDLVRTKRASVWTSSQRALRFCFGHMAHVLGLGLLFLLLNILVFAGYALTRNALDLGSTPGIGLALLIGVVYTLVRAWIRIATWGGEMALLYSVFPREVTSDDVIEKEVDHAFESTLPGVDQFSELAPGMEPEPEEDSSDGHPLDPSDKAPRSKISSDALASMADAVEESRKQQPE